MNAMQHIQRGECDIMLAGASDAAIIPMGMAGFQAAKALSKRNDDCQVGFQLAVKPLFKPFYHRRIQL